MKHAVVLLLVSIVLCSGCGRQASIPPILNLPDCPAPSVPILPELDAAESLDSPENVACLLARDDALRAYIGGLDAALRCYQARGNHGK